MQLFAVSFDVPSVRPGELCDALREAGRWFPRFAESAPWSATSASGDVVVATMHHPEDLLGPRAYRAEAGSLVAAYDGMPVHRDGRWAAHDAAELLAHWDELPEVAEGQFTALRADLERDEVALLTDAFGIAPLYHVELQGGHVVANSVEVLRRVTGASAPSPLGVSSFVCTGWTAGDATLLAGIHALPGGHEYRLTRAGLVRRPYLTPATLAAHARSGVRVSTDEIVTDMVRLTSAAAATGLPIRCGLTEGRDTRVLLALLQAAGAPDVTYYTSGGEGDADVDGAREIAAGLGLRHVLLPLEVPDDVMDWSTLAKTFVSQTDGLSSLLQIGDYNDQVAAPAQLGLKTPGLGGELGRGGVRLTPYATNVLIVNRSQRAQRQLLLERAREHRSLWTRDAIAEYGEFIDRFIHERRAEGWKVRELSEAHYAFDRVTRWGSTSLRRTAGTDDVFSPYCSRSFATYCLSLTPGERYVEAPHYRILSALSPRLRDFPVGKPWKPQDPRIAPALATSDVARKVVGRLKRRSAGPGAAPVLEPYPMRWFRAHAAEHREICLATEDSPLWAYIDRSQLEAAFRAGAPGPLREGLVRATTLAWYFHGRHLR
jgi:hypothetical protein